MDVPLFPAPPDHPIRGIKRMRLVTRVRGCPMPLTHFYLPPFHSIFNHRSGVRLTCFVKAVAMESTNQLVVISYVLGGMTTLTSLLARRI